MFVRVDLTRKLPDKIISCFSNGRELEIEVSWPWLPVKCDVCGKYDHSSERCRPVVPGAVRDLRPQASTSPRHSRHRSKSRPVRKSELRSSDKVEEPSERIESYNFQAAHAVPPAEFPIEVIKSDQEETEAKKRSKSRSRSLRRSQSRAKARALSSPPEGSGASANVAADSMVRQINQETLRAVAAPLLESALEAKIVSVAPGSSKEEGELDEDGSEWFTKHSKASRRAIRQEELRKVSSSCDPLIKSYKFLIRGSPRIRGPVSDFFSSNIVHMKLFSWNIRGLNDVEKG